MADFLGRPPESIYGLGWGSVVHPDDVREHIGKVMELVDGEIWSFQAETRFRLLDRKVRWGLVGMSLVADEAGRPRHLFATVTNITDRVRSETRLFGSRRPITASSSTVLRCRCGSSISPTLRASWA